MDKARTEAFSDGVIAVAITVLALALPVPNPASTPRLGHYLGEHWPSFAAFAVSFVTIGIIWINHHATFRRLTSVDHIVLMLNLLLLLSICVIPFSTAVMAEYLTSANGENFAAVIFGGSLLLMSVAFFAMQQHLLRAKPYLLHEHLTPSLRRKILRRNAVGLLPYALATIAGVVSPYLTLGIAGAVAAFYAAPGTTADAIREPSEPEEADRE
jgi:uncharacterized membrane protein